MGQPVTAANQLQLNFQQVVTFGIGPSTVALPAPVKLRSIFQNSGVLADQCNLVYEAPLTFTASTPQTLDLKSGLFDLAGVALVFARVRCVMIRNNATTDTWVLTVGAAGANEWDGLVSNTGTFPVYPSTATNDGFFLSQLPNTTGSVVDSTHHLLKLDPGSHAFSVDILIAGCDA